MRVLVASWAGSKNLGDELILAALQRKLAGRGAEVTAISVDPAATAEMGVAAVGSGDVRGLWRAAGSADAVVLGGGGLLQDETSVANLPYHLSRVWLGRARGLPFAGVGLGAGPLRGSVGRRLVRATLGRAVAVSVRDEPSAALLRSVGVGTGGSVVVAADLALSLPVPTVEPADRLVVCLRPWSGGGHWLPVSWRRRLARVPVAGIGSGGEGGAPDWFVSGMAQSLDLMSASSGLAVHFVALEGDRDDAVHRAVAERMSPSSSSAVTFATPSVENVVDEVAGSRAVVALRYHAGIAAVLGGRPAVLVGYSPKVDALAGEMGGAGARLAWSPEGLAGIPQAVENVLGREAEMAAAREQLRERERGNDVVIDRLLEAAAAAGGVERR